MPRGARGVLADDGGARRRGLRPCAEHGVARAGPRRSARGAAGRRPARVAPPTYCPDPRRHRGGRGSRRARDRTLGRGSLERPGRDAGRTRARAGGRCRPRRPRVPLGVTPAWRRRPSRRHARRPGGARRRRARPGARRQDIRDVGRVARWHPQRAGLFPGGDGRDVVPVDGIVEAGQVVLVTVEEEGGVDAPTSEPILGTMPV